MGTSATTVLGTLAVKWVRHTQVVLWLGVLGAPQLLADCPAVSFVHICIHICLLTMTMKFPKNLCKCINRPSRHKNQETSQSHCSDPKNAQSRNCKIVFTIKKKRVHIENWQRVWMSWKGYWEGYWSHHFNNFPKIHAAPKQLSKKTHFDFCKTKSANKNFFINLDFS